MKKEIKNTRADYHEQFKKDSARQFMDCGISIPEDFSPNGKALGLIHILKNMEIGYKVDFTDLIEKKWQKWNKGQPSFKSTDVLSAKDVKDAIRGFYLMVLKGELKFSNISRMLEMTAELRDNKVVYTLNVVEFKEGLFSISKTEKKEKSKPKLVDTLSTLLKAKNLTAEEKAVIKEAVEKLNNIKKFKMVA